MALILGFTGYNQVYLRHLLLMDGFKPKMSPTVWLQWIAHFAVGILLLHHYNISDLYSLVIGMYKYERREKNNLKKEGLVANLQKFAHFWVVLVRKYMVKENLIYDRFDFLDRFSGFS